MGAFFAQLISVGKIKVDPRRPRIGLGWRIRLQSSRGDVSAGQSRWPQYGLSKMLNPTFIWFVVKPTAAPESMNA